MTWSLLGLSEALGLPDHFGASGEEDPPAFEDRGVHGEEEAQEREARDGGERQCARERDERKERPVARPGQDQQGSARQSNHRRYQKTRHLVGKKEERKETEAEWIEEVRVPPERAQRPVGDASLAPELAVDGPA